MKTLSVSSVVAIALVLSCVVGCERYEEKFRASLAVVESIDAEDYKKIVLNQVEQERLEIESVLLINAGYSNGSSRISQKKLELFALEKQVAILREQIVDLEEALESSGESREGNLIVAINIADTTYDPLMLRLHHLYSCQKWLDKSDAYRVKKAACDFLSEQIDLQVTSAPATRSVVLANFYNSVANNNWDNSLPINEVPFPPFIPISVQQMEIDVNGATVQGELADIDSL